MADKNGTPQQQRNACFPTTPAKATGGCPLNGPDVAIIPMRYALDRSRYDENPKKLKPLLKTGKWAAMPALKTRSYTLRQLRNGYVYVFDETEKTLHEYEYNADTAMLTRIKWDGGLMGKDSRAGSGPGKTHLLYPRKNTIRIAYSTLQWTWRICEYMRSNGGNRKAWMQTLDLKEYCLTMKSPHVLPLAQLAEAAADIDKGTVTKDKRFADSVHPPESTACTKESVVPLAADIVWIGSVSDPVDALVIALDDYLAILKELNFQLIADQAAYIHWQNEHQHKLSIAGIVDTLCGTGSDKRLLPLSVANDDNKSRQYISEVEAYFDQLKTEEMLTSGPDGFIALASTPANSMADAIKNKYGELPKPELRQSWEMRTKWRRQADLEKARLYIKTTEQKGIELHRTVLQTQRDLFGWAEFVGPEPLRIYIDTTTPDQLLYMQALMAEFLKIIGQDVSTSKWIAEQELKSKSLFGLARVGFSAEINSALTNEANKIVQSATDYPAIISRIGEMNSFLTHDDIINKKWVQTLTEPARKTLGALEKIAASTGKIVLEQTLLALLPVDSRLAQGKQASLPALLKNIVIGNFLLNHPDKIQIDNTIDRKLKTWKSEFITASTQYDEALKAWNTPRANRTNLAKTLDKLENNIQRLANEIPALLDYKNNSYVEILRKEIRTGKVQLAAKQWSAKYGVNAASITWGVAIANIFNTAITYNSVTKDSEFDKKDIVKITSSAAYMGNAFMAVFVETKWAALKNLEIVVGKQTIKLMETSAAHWPSQWKNLIKGFGARLVFLGAFSLIATGSEWWDIQDDLSTTTNKDERTALIAKQTAVAGMLIIGSIQLIAGLAAILGQGSLAVVLMNPWFAGAALVAGIVYLISTLALNYFKRDAIGQWLHKCCWSRDPEERFPSTLEGQTEETRSFLEIQLSPSVFVKPTYQSITKYVPRIGMTQKTDVRDGAWIQIQLPPALHGRLLHTNLVGSHRPLYMLPMEKTEGELKDAFMSNSDFKKSNTLGLTPRTKPTHSLYPSPNISEKDTSLTLQTWVPLSEKAQNLELQIWYPIEVLASGEGDRGYRYQLELSNEGINDHKDTRISASDKSTLQVQTLGGRMQGAVVPIPL